MAHAGQKIRLRQVGAVGYGTRAFELNIFFLQDHVKALAFGDVTRRRKDALQDAVAVVKGGGVVRHHGFFAVPGSYRQFVVGDFFTAQHHVDGSNSSVWLGEELFEGRTNQLVARAVGEFFGLLVDVGDDAGGIGRHDRVNVGFDQRARVELLVAQALVEFFLLFFNQLTGGVVCANQEVANDGVLCITQGRHRHHRRKATAVFSDVGQLVNIFNAA